MSPGIDAAFPWLLDVFGGRQTARTIHFICATLIVLFVLVHVVMVLISGVWNNIRSMITGRYARRRQEKPWPVIRRSSRRSFLKGAAAAGGALALAGLRRALASRRRSANVLELGRGR